MYKVYNRMVYCSTFGQWIKETIFCHIVLKWFAKDIDQISCKSCIGSRPMVGEWNEVKDGIKAKN